jgi:hypothetical protein
LPDKGCDQQQYNTRKKELWALQATSHWLV